MTVVRLSAILLALVLLASPVTAGKHSHLPARPNTEAYLRAGPIAPNGTLIRDGERLRTLELNELAPLRLRISIPF